MSEFQTINEVVNNAIEHSSYISVLISSCVFIVYTLTIKVIDYYKAKDKSKPMLEMATALKEVSANVVKLNSVLDKVFKDAEIKEEQRCKTSIGLAFAKFTNVICRDAIDIILHNHLDDNEGLIKENVSKLVSTEYYKLYAALSTYEIAGINAGSKLNKQWIEDTTNVVLSIMFNGQEITRRISQINNQVHTYAETYAIYVENKLFNS